MNTVSDASEIGSTTVSLVTSSNASGVLFAALHKLLSYIKYLNIAYSRNLEDVLKAKKSESILIRYLPSIPQSIVDDLVAKQIHPIFPYRKVGPTFLGNFWKLSLFFGILILCSAIVTGLMTLFKNKKSSEKILKIFKTIRLVLVKLFIMQFYLNAGDMVLFVILELRSVVLDTPVSNLSLFISLMFLVFGVCVFTFHFFILKSLTTLSKLENFINQQRLKNFKEKYEDFDLLYKQWKEKSLSQAIYLLLFTFRDICLNIVISNLFEHTVLQSLLFVFITFSFWSYLIIARPFKKFYDNVKQIFLEIIVLLTYLFALMVLSTNSNPDSHTIKEVLGEAVIVLAIIFNVVAGLFIMIDILTISYEAYKDWKAQKQPKKVFPEAKISSGEENLSMSQARLNVNNTSVLEDKKAESNIEGNSYLSDKYSQAIYSNNENSHIESPYQQSQSTNKNNSQYGFRSKRLITQRPHLREAFDPLSFSPQHILDNSSLSPFSNSFNESDQKLGNTLGVLNPASRLDNQINLISPLQTKYNMDSVQSFFGHASPESINVMKSAIDDDIPLTHFNQVKSGYDKQNNSIQSNYVQRGPELSNDFVKQPHGNKNNYLIENGNRVNSTKITNLNKFTSDFKTYMKAKNKPITNGQTQVSSLKKTIQGQVDSQFMKFEEKGEVLNQSHDNEKYLSQGQEDSVQVIQNKVVEGENPDFLSESHNNNNFPSKLKWKGVEFS